MVLVVLPEQRSNLSMILRSLSLLLFSESRALLESSAGDEDWLTVMYNQVT